MNKQKVLFIINPVSGTGKQLNVPDLIQAKLDHSKFEYTIKYTEYRGHATTLSSEAIGHFDIVIAVGGDGTVNEVAKGLISSEVIMGIIPVGSGNGLARHLNLSMKLPGAIKIINELKTTYIDTATINNETFVNVAGVGFDAHIAHMFANTKKRGPVPYVKIATVEFGRYVGKKYHINIDGIDYSREAFVVSFANSAQFGNNAYISPKAQINDGLIDVCMLSNFPKVEAGQLAIKLFNKRLDHTKYMQIVRGKVVRLSSTENLQVHIDGEPVNFTNKIEVEIKPSSLLLINNYYKNITFFNRFKW